MYLDVLHDTFGSVSKLLHPDPNIALTVAIDVVNLFKTRSLKSRMFSVRYEDVEAKHKSLPYYFSVRWLS